MPSIEINIEFNLEYEKGKCFACGMEVNKLHKQYLFVNFTPIETKVKLCEPCYIKSTINESITNFSNTDD